MTLTTKILYRAFKNDFCGAANRPISFPEVAILLVSDRDLDLWDNPFATTGFLLSSQLRRPEPI